jgi:hypothetical protein
MVIFQIYSQFSRILLGHWLDKGNCRYMEGLNEYFASLSGRSQWFDTFLSLSAYNSALDKPYPLNLRFCISSIYVGKTTRHMTFYNSLSFVPIPVMLVFGPIYWWFCSSAICATGCDLRHRPRFAQWAAFRSMNWHPPDRPQSAPSAAFRAMNWHPPDRPQSAPSAAICAETLKKTKQNRSLHWRQIQARNSSNWKNKLEKPLRVEPHWQNIIEIKIYSFYRVSVTVDQSRSIRNRKVKPKTLG